MSFRSNIYNLVLKYENNMIDTYLNGIKITDSNDGNEGQELFF